MSSWRCTATPHSKRPMACTARECRAAAAAAGGPRPQRQQRTPRAPACRQPGACLMCHRFCTGVGDTCWRAVRAWLQAQVAGGNRHLRITRARKAKRVVLENDRSLSRERVSGHRIMLGYAGLGPPAPESDGGGWQIPSQDQLLRPGRAGRLTVSGSEQRQRSLRF